MTVPPVKSTDRCSPRVARKITAITNETMEIAFRIFE